MVRYKGSKRTFLGQVIRLIKEALHIPRILTASFRVKPDFLIVGAQKWEQLRFMGI